MLGGCALAYWGPPRPEEAVRSPEAGVAWLNGGTSVDAGTELRTSTRAGSALKPSESL